MRFGTWNVRSLCRSRCFKTEAIELREYKLYLLGVQEVSRSRGSSGIIVSDYGLDDRGSFPGRGREFFF
jgi:hypothetical protein